AQDLAVCRYDTYIWMQRRQLLDRGRVAQRLGLEHRNAQPDGHTLDRRRLGGAPTPKWPIRLCHNTHDLVARLGGQRLKRKSRDLRRAKKDDSDHNIAPTVELQVLRRSRSKAVTPAAVPSSMPLFRTEKPNPAAKTEPMNTCQTLLHPPCRL